MKKILLSIFLLLMVSMTAFAEEIFEQHPLLQEGIVKYKEGNYTGCLQNMKKVLDEDPSDALARYYLAISYVKVGNLSAAKEQYNNVIAISTSSQLTSYSKIGIKCIDEPEKCPSRGAKNVVQTVVTTTEQVPDDIKKMLEQQKLNNLKEMINGGNKINPKKINEFESFDEEDRSDIPTNEQVASAIKTLQKAGYNNLSNPYANPQAMQMNMLMSSMAGGQQMNGMGQMNNMMPLMMMQQGNNKIDPQVLQTMMMSSMMPGMFSGFETKDNKY